MQCSRVVCCRSLKDQRIIEHSSERPLGMNSKWAERWCCPKQLPIKGVTPMRHRTSLPHSLRCILDGFSDCFTEPTFNAFSALVAGFIARPTSRTVCGMLTGGRTVPIRAPLQNAPVHLRVTMVGPPGRPDTGRPGCPAPDWSRRADTGRAGRDAAAPPGPKGACHRMAARRLRSRQQPQAAGSAWATAGSSPRWSCACRS